MNKDTAKDYLPLVQALSEGKVIQIRNTTEREWVDLDTGEIAFSSGAEQYRIKPEPREVWVNHYGDTAPGAMAWSNKQIAKNQAGDGAIQVRYREVIE